MVSTAHALRSMHGMARRAHRVITMIELREDKGMNHTQRTEVEIKKPFFVTGFSFKYSKDRQI